LKKVNALKKGTNANKFRRIQAGTSRHQAALLEIKEA
jgi:hypothetical protein